MDQTERYIQSLENLLLNGFAEATGMKESVAALLTDAKANGNVPSIVFVSAVNAQLEKLRGLREIHQPLEVEVRTLQLTAEVLRMKLERITGAAKLALAAMETVGEASVTNLAGEDEEYVTADMDTIREASDQVREALTAIDKEEK